MMRMLAKGRARVALVAAMFGLVACQGSDAPTTTTTTVPTVQISGDTSTPPQDDNWRLLTQATFGPSEDSMVSVTNLGTEEWIDEQLSMGAATSFLTFMNRRDAELKAVQADDRARPAQLIEAFYTRALTDPAQLRARVLFALSEIFVVSLADEGLFSTGPMAVAHYLDTLDAGIDGTYRQLLENITKSPAMGWYLTFRGNAKEDPATGHLPDENYAREILQLFSIGLVELNMNGTAKLDGSGQPIPAYTSRDIKGLAKVFTGWSNHYGLTGNRACTELMIFAWDVACRDPQGYVRSMVPYPNFHSTSVKSFLGVTIDEQKNPDPEASLKKALDTIANHPNTAPFISKQLIQRLVSSNPSPAYVARVAATFKLTGGRIKDVIRAILMDPEARKEGAGVVPGKLREPVLRLTAVLRAFKFTSPTLDVSVLAGAPTPYLTPGMTSDSSTSLNQTPLFAPSVFNFFRPGYAPPQSDSTAHVAPEMQLVSESAITGYANAMQSALTDGIGPYTEVTLAQGNKVVGTAHNLNFDLVAQRAYAADADQLAKHVADRLLGGALSEYMNNVLVNALNSIPVPALKSDQSNAAAVHAALDSRVRAAILMVSVSPEFLVTR
jgi:uncharacterized protein (DUF1800 family)